MFEELEFINKNIADRFAKIFNSHQIDYWISGEGGYIWMANKYDAALNVDLTICLLRPKYDYESDFFRLPGSFSVPIYSYNIWNRDGTIVATTPYGEIPEEAIGLDSKLYLMQNRYFFSGQQAIKLEDIQKSDDRFNPQDPAMIHLPQLGFIPQPQDTRFVPLDSRDYVRTGLVLYLIDTGIIQIRT